MRLILCCMALLGDRPWGVSLGKTSSKALKRVTKGWENSLASADSWLGRIHSLEASNSGVESGVGW